MDTTKEKQEGTEFKGVTPSLDAILAATSKDKGVKVDIEKAPPVQQPPKQQEVPKVEEKEGQKTETATEPKKEEPQRIEVPPVPQTETEAYKVAKRMLDNGMLDDFSIQTSEDDQEGTPISEFKQMSEEDLKEIIAIHKQESADKIKSEYIPKEGLKEHQLKVIEILKNGGDLSQIAETPDRAFERPFEGYDMEDQKAQIDVVYTDLTSGKGLNHEKAVELIKIGVQKGTIADDAQEVFDNYRKAHANYIDEMLEKQKKDKEFKDLNFKENKKALTEKLKESGLKEAAYKKVASEYGKKNENGDYALMDKLREVLDNPEKNHELILHLADPSLFNEIFKIKASQETQRTIVRLNNKQASQGNRQSQKTTNTEQISPWQQAAEIYNKSLTNQN